MPLTKLDHFLIRSDDIESTKDFYVETLGMTVGKRPPFQFPGYWLYLDGVACVHLAPSQSSAQQRDYLGEQDACVGTGPIDHIAFSADGLQETITHLESLQLEMIRRDVPGQDLHQIFIIDPNGIRIELNFDLAICRT